MNILHVIESLDPALGGTTVSSLSLATAQAVLKHNVTIICYKDNADEVEKEQMKDSIPNMDLVKIIYLDIKGFVEKIFASQAGHVLEKHIKNADAVQLHGMWRPILLKACQISQVYNKKYIITPHGMLDPWSLKQSALKKKTGLLLGWRKALNKCCYIHALNQTEKVLLNALNLKCDIYVFPNGIFASFANNIPERNKFYKLHPELKQRPYILFLSRLHYKKGLDYLAAAFVYFCKQNQDIDLVVAGPDGGAQTEFEAIINKNGLSKRVFVPGPVYGEEKIAALTDAFCFCLPSRQEGFSMAITEALACSTPVVISKDCHFPEVKQANAGYVTNLDAKEIADSWLNLALDDNRRERMSSAAKKLVYENYVWEKIAEKVIEKYQAVL